MTKPKNMEINAILGEEFDRLLETLGVKQDFETGKYKCSVCGDIVSAINVSMIFPINEKDIGFVCRKTTCGSVYKNKTGCGGQ
jgi:hypothetical protein